MAKIAQTDKRARLAVWISPSIDRAIKVAAAAQGIDKREAVERALRAYLRNREAA